MKTPLMLGCPTREQPLPRLANHLIWLQGEYRPNHHLQQHHQVLDPRGSSCRDPAANLDRTTRQMPRGRVPINAAPYNTSNTPAAFGNRSPNQQPEAAAIANDKGREIAEQLAKVKMDGRKESAVLPKAVMLCAAGHLIGDTSLIDKGKALAREVESVARRHSPWATHTDCKQHEQQQQ